MQSRTRRDRDVGSASDALADIALNMLGLVLIVLLVYILMFQQTTAKLAAATQNVQSASATYTPVMDQPAEAKTEQSSDLWRFRIVVDGLVDDSGRRTPANFTVEYFVHLDIKGNSATGMLFGVKEDQKDGRASSASHAKIDGDLQGPRANLELHFTGYASGASERLIVTRMGDAWIGRLESGKCIPGANNYSGEAVGTRLDESVFASS